MEKINKFFKTKLGFSLIELMISLIAISCITAAFTPVISKKLQSGEITIGAETRMSGDCQEIDEYCQFCELNKGICALCTRPCGSNETANKDTCKCIKCDNSDSSGKGVANCTQSCVWNSKNSRIYCTQCKNGYYVNNNDGTCVSCSTGNYCNGKTQTKCSNNQYQNEQGKSSCKPCATGATSQQGAEKCTCPTNCATCNSTTDGACSKCTNSTFLHPTSKLCVAKANCPAGYYGDSASGTCKQCEQGYYCTGGDKKQCEAGYYCTGGANRTACNSGTYSEAGKNSCTTCTAGYKCPGGTNRQYCSGGTYQTLTGQSVCNNCEAGYKCSGGANHDKCAAGTYSEAGKNSCTTCTAGYKCPGGTNRQYCSAGTYQTSTGQTVCNNCGAGYYCTGGTARAQCPAGKYSTATNAQNANACANCGAGYYCTGGSNRTACAANKYSTATNATAASTCSNCASGASSNAGSSKCNCVANCATCSTNGACSTCNTGYKVSNGSCVSCNVANCTGYSSGCTCNACVANYEPDGAGGCKQSYLTYTYGNLQWTTRNAGDPGGPAIPATVNIFYIGTNVCQKGASQSNSTCGTGVPTCWKAATSSDYTAASWSGSYTTLDGYSGKNRTVCNRQAAAQICSAIGYRVPTLADLSAKNWNTIREMALCDKSASSSTYAKCESSNNCTGVYSNTTNYQSGAYCNPSAIQFSNPEQGGFGSDCLGYQNCAYISTGGNWSKTGGWCCDRKSAPRCSYYYEGAASVRCVKTI